MPITGIFADGRVHPVFSLQRFRDHPKNRAKALHADRKLRTIVGARFRELRRNLKSNCRFDGLLALFERVLSQKHGFGNKVYSLHEPQVVCISSKEKEHKKYESGNKVSIIRSADGIILGAKSFRNEYDGHTIEESLRQVERVTGRKIRCLAGDRGYKGRKKINGTRILIPDTPNDKDSYYTRRKKHRLFCKCAGIEPTIGHLKNVSSTQSEQSKLCVNSSYNIDTRLLRETAVRGDCA